MNRDQHTIRMDVQHATSDLRNHTQPLTLDDITTASNPHGPDTTVLVTPDQMHHVYGLLQAQVPLARIPTDKPLRWHGTTITIA